MRWGDLGPPSPPGSSPGLCGRGHRQGHPCSTSSYFPPLRPFSLGHGPCSQTVTHSKKRRVQKSRALFSEGLVIGEGSAWGPTCSVVPAQAPPPVQLPREGFLSAAACPPPFTWASELLRTRSSRGPMCGKPGGLCNLGPVLSFNPLGQSGENTCHTLISGLRTSAQRKPRHLGPMAVQILP